MTQATRRNHPLRDLPLFWKLLVPFLALVVILGAVGAFVIVHDLSARAQTQLDQDLARRSLDARSTIHDRELYLLESANFASNIEGLAAALRSNDYPSAARLLASVVGLKPDLSVAVIAGTDGVAVAELRTGTVRPGRAGAWGNEAFVRRALGDSLGGKSSEVVTRDGRALLAVASPVCAQTKPCAPAGVAIVGLDVSRLASEAAQRAGLSVALFSTDGKGLASSGSVAPGAPPSSSRLVRRTYRAGETEVATLWVPLSVQNRAVGTIAVTEPTAPAFAAVRRAVKGLALILAAAMAGVVGLGAFLSRRILAQVGPLVETNRALGRGELSARAPVLSRDEIGELASGVNQMAEQLEASVATLERRVAERTAEVRRLLVERTEFFAAMSHELRTPLAVIEGQAQLIVDPAAPRAAAFKREAGETIIESTGQLLSFVNDILDLAKSERGGLSMELQSVSLQESLAALRATIDGLAGAAGLRVAVTLPKKPAIVRADPRRLHGILINLIDNAVKYTPAGGRISIAVATNGERASVVVTDTGVGIPSEVHGRIFEPFYHVPGSKPERGRASSGLGLALAKRLAVAQGGDLTFVSEPGAGSTFTLALPRAQKAI